MVYDMDGWRDRLAFEIHARGFKLTKLSTAMGFHRDYVSNVLSGKAKPSTEKLERICHEVGVPFAHVLFGDKTDQTDIDTSEDLTNPALPSVQSMIVEGDFSNGFKG